MERRPGLVVTEGSFEANVQLHKCVVCLAVVLYFGFRHLVQNLTGCHIVITGASCPMWVKLNKIFINCFVSIYKKKKNPITLIFRGQ